MKCQYCKSGDCHKRGFQRNGVQKYSCKRCGKHQLEYYTRRGWQPGMDNEVAGLLMCGVGIRRTAWKTGMSPNTVLAKIRRLAASVERPAIRETNQTYELYELRTFVGSKRSECWICYAINRATKQEVDFCVGARNRANIGRVVNTMLALNPKKVCTDRLNIYPLVIPDYLHKSGKRQTNHIERTNLTLRTHLKRLARRTICFTRSADMLGACVRVHLWHVYVLR